MEIRSKADLDNLIKNKLEENTNLEYKSPESLNNNREIAKDISAMANSNGGIIIYGLCEDNYDHKPASIQWLTDHQKKEKIEQVLQSSVTPKINVNMNIIENNDNNLEFVLIVEVPKSDSAPHQDHFDKDKKIYWRRNGYTTRQMEHYEIEDLFFKRKRPLLTVSLGDINKIEPTYPIEILNIGKVMAEKIAIKILIPSEFVINGDGWSKLEEKYGSYGKHTAYQYFDDKMPVYPKIPQIIGIFEHPNKKKIVEEMKIGLYVVCKDMETKIYEIILKKGELMKKVYEFEELRGLPIPYCKFVDEW